MTVLRRVLHAFAAVWFICGLALLIVPGVLVETTTEIGSSDTGIARIAGALSIGLAMFAVLVARRDDAWWWSWAFAVVTGLCGTVSVFHAALDPGSEGDEVRWWLFFAVNAVLTAGLVLGLTRASQDHPIG